MRRKQPPRESPLQCLQREMLETQRELNRAYERFDQAVEPELVEACIYEISALNARFSYLYRQIKEQTPCARAAEREEAAVWV